LLKRFHILTKGRRLVIGIGHNQDLDRLLRLRSITILACGNRSTIIISPNIIVVRLSMYLIVIAFYDYLKTMLNLSLIYFIVVFLPTTNQTLQYIKIRPAIGCTIHGKWWAYSAPSFLLGYPTIDRIFAMQCSNFALKF
jgi:hypothetical protein